MVLLLPCPISTQTRSEIPHGAQGIGQEFGPGLGSRFLTVIPGAQGAGDDQLLGGFSWDLNGIYRDLMGFLWIL